MTGRRTVLPPDGRRKDLAIPVDVTSLLRPRHGPARLLDVSGTAGRGEPSPGPLLQAG